MEGEAKAMKAWWTPVMTKGRRLHVRAANRKPAGFIAFNLATFNSAVLYIHTLGSRSFRAHTWTYTRSCTHTERTKGCHTGHLLRSWGKYTGQTEYCVFTGLGSGALNIAPTTAYEGQLWATELNYSTRAILVARFLCNLDFFTWSLTSLDY